jgi:hypothetical protein
MTNQATGYPVFMEQLAAHPIVYKKSGFARSLECRDYKYWGIYHTLTLNLKNTA